MMSEPKVVGDDEAQAFVDRIRAHRRTLTEHDRQAFDALLVATASGAESDVEAYGFGSAEGRQLALAAVMALGLVGGALSAPLAGTAAAAPLEQPTLNGNMGGGTSGSSTRPSGGTQPTPSQPQAPSPNRGAGGNVAGLTGSPGITVMGAPLPPTHGAGPSAGGTIYGTNDPRAAALALQQAQQNIQNQIRTAQQQSREAGNQLWGPLAPQTRDLIYDNPPPARTPPSLAPETRDLIYDNPPPVLPPQIRGPDPRSTDQSNLADLTTQIENLQNQLNQLQQQTRQAPPAPPADWSNALPTTDPGAAEATYRQRLAALDGQAAAWVALNPGADQTPIAPLTQAQRTIQGHLDALIAHSRTTARNANVQSGEAPPPANSQAADDHDIRRAQQRGNPYQNLGNDLRDAGAQALSGGQPAQPGPRMVTPGTPGAVDEEIREQDHPPGSSSPAPSPTVRRLTDQFNSER